jgi:hypothetical protein
LAETRTITVHAFDDARVHLAPAHLGRLKQGRLMTLCGRLAVTALSPFAAAAGDRCRTCFGKVDEHGYVNAAADAAETRASRAKPGARVVPLPTGKKASRRAD